MNFVNLSTILCWYCAFSLQLYEKRDTRTDVFLGILQVFSACNVIKDGDPAQMFFISLDKFFSMQIYQKRDSSIGVFLWDLQEHLRRAATSDIITGRFFCKIYCSLKCKIKGYQR